MEETISRILAELEGSHHDNQAPLPHSTIQDFQSLLDSGDSSLLSSLSSSMASPSLPASLLFLSLLLSPSSLSLSLFSPMPFLSLLCSLRHAPRRKRNSNKHRHRRTHLQEEEEEEAAPPDSGTHFDVRVFFGVLEKLELVIASVHLDRFPDCMRCLVQTVTELPVLAAEAVGGCGSGGYGRLLDCCARILREVLKCDGKGDMAAEVIRSLTPLLITAGGRSQARTFALGFVREGVRKGLFEEKVVGNVPRYLALKAPEKAEPRGLAVEAITEVFGVLGSEGQLGFVEFVVGKMVQGKANLRLLAVDLIQALIVSMKDCVFEVDLDCGLENSWGARCVKALIQRCSDVNGAIRARALSSLANLVGIFGGDERSRKVLKVVMGFRNRKEGEGVEEGGINELLRKRCVDEKAVVRKAALLFVTKLTALLGGCFDGVLLKMMGMACSDQLVSIRKAAVSALSEVTNY